MKGRSVPIVLSPPQAHSMSCLSAHLIIAFANLLCSPSLLLSLPTSPLPFPPSFPLYFTPLPTPSRSPSLLHPSPTLPPVLQRAGLVSSTEGGPLMGAKAHQRGTAVLQKQIAAQERKIAEVSFAQQYLGSYLIYGGYKYEYR